MRKSINWIAIAGFTFGVLAIGAWTSVNGSLGGVLLPGASDITTSHLHNAVASYEYFLRMPTGDTTERRVSAGRAEQVLTQYDGKPALLLIGSSTPNGASSIDSALVRLPTLAPVWETARRGGRVTHWDYSGKDVRMTVTPPDSATQTRQHTYEMPVFNFQELDVLLRSLPLREGYDAILPLYSEGGNVLEMDTVRVVSRESDGKWTVRFADNDIVATYGINGKTREIVSHEMLQRRSGGHVRKVMSP